MGRKLSIAVHHEGDDGQNLITVIGNKSRSQFLDHCFGDAKGRGAQGDELFAHIDDKAIHFNLIADAIHRFQEYYGITKQYEIDLTCWHGSGELVSFEMIPYDGRV